MIHSRVPRFFKGSSNLGLSAIPLGSKGPARGVRVDQRLAAIDFDKASNEDRALLSRISLKAIMGAAEGLEAHQAPGDSEAQTLGPPSKAAILAGLKGMSDGIESPNMKKVPQEQALGYLISGSEIE